MIATRLHSRRCSNANFYRQNTTLRRSSSYKIRRQQSTKLPPQDIPYVDVDLNENLEDVDETTKVEKVLE